MIPKISAREGRLKRGKERNRVNRQRAVGVRKTDSFVLVFHNAVDNFFDYFTISEKSEPKNLSISVEIVDKNRVIHIKMLITFGFMRIFRDNYQQFIHTLLCIT